MGIAGIIGAFAAGIAISQTEYKHEVEHKIEPIAYAIFVPVFFVNIGMEITFQGIGSQLWFIIIMTHCNFHKVNLIRLRSETDRI